MDKERKKKTPYSFTVRSLDEINLESFPVPLNNPRTFKERLADAKEQPDIKKLVGNIWYSGELHILFADTGLGKSVKTVAIGDALSKGVSYLGLENENEPLRVLYYDFELSDKQAELRYSNSETGENYEFNENFISDFIDLQTLSMYLGELDFSQVILQVMKREILRQGIDVLIIDNITFLTLGITQNQDVAKDLMRELVQLKRQFDISILIIAHTPKIPAYTPLDVSFLSGSKHLSNFADSISAMGRSNKGESIRYWKQIKASRSGEMLYGNKNVINVEMVKKDDVFLTFNHLGYASERSHLVVQKDNEIPEQVTKAAEYVKEEKSYAEIAKLLNTSKGNITKWKNKYPDVFT